MRLWIKISLIFVSIFSGYSQTTGDFRSFATGNWNTNATWQFYNGTAWVVATSYPGQTVAGANVTIQNSHVVTINVTPPNSIANLTVGGGTSGSLTGDGSIRNLTVSGNLSVAFGGVFNFNSNNITINGTSNITGSISDDNGNGSNIFNGLVTINSSASVNTTNNSPYTFGGGISNSGTFSKTGTGAVTLSSATGITNSGTTFTMNGATAMTVSQTITANAAMTFGGNITASPAANIDYAGTNTLLLSGTGTYNANYSTNGTVSVTNSGTTTISGNLTIGTGSILTINTGNFTVSGTSAINGGFTDNNDAGNNLFTGKVTIASSGTWNTSAANSTTDRLRFIGGIDNNNSNPLQILFGRARFQGANQTINSACDLTFNLIRLGESTDASRFNYTFNCNVITNAGDGLSVDGGGSSRGGLFILGTGFYLQIPATVTGASQTQGWVVGNLRRTAALNSTGLTFNVGTLTSYTPVVLSYNAATLAGTSTVKSIAGDHPNISISCLNSSRSINQNISYENTFVTSRLDATVSFQTSDIDASTTVASLVGGVFSGAKWVYPNVNGTPSTSVALRVLPQISGAIQLGEINSGYVMPGDPTVFGNGVWNAYSYNSNSSLALSNYRGFFTYNSMNFDTRTSDVVSVNGDPTPVSAVSTFQGCTMPIDNFTVSFKRTNFTPGIYQMDMNGHDDNAFIYINDVLVRDAGGYNTAVQTNLWTTYLSATDKVEVRWLEGTGGHYATFAMTNVTPAALTPGTVSGDQSYCTGETPIKILSSVLAATTGCNVLTYQWQSSTDNTIWTDIATAANAVTYTLPSNITQNTYYRRKVSDNCARVAYSNTVLVSIYNSAPGNDAIYGDGKWIAYGYASQTFTGYKGYFNYTSQNFDTRTSDLIGNTTGSISTIPNYMGCTMPADNFSVRFRRTNFPAGIYQIDLNGHDDYERIYKNGVLIFQNNGYLASSEINAWTGSISSSDLIDIEWVEGTGGNFATFAMTKLSVTPTALDPGVISSNQTICSGDYPLLVLTGTAATSGCSVVPSYGTTTIYGPYQWQVSYDNVNWVDITTNGTSSSYTIPTTPTFSVDTWYRRRAIDQCGIIAYSNLVKITIDNTIYGDPTSYPSNAWRVYSYKDNNFTTYSGYFPVSTDSYDSQTYYTSSQSPYYATGYLGCTVPATNYSTSVKRKGFTSDIYEIKVLHDNDGRLLINGNQVYNSTVIVPTATSVWIGPLNSTSQIDWRFRAYGATNNTSISVLPITPTTLNGGTIDGDKIVCRGDIPSPFTNLTLSSGGCYTSATTDYYWQYSTNSGSTWTTLASSIGTSYAPVQTIFAETWYRRAVKDVCGSVAYSNIAKVTINNTPPGDPSVFPNGSWNAYTYDDPDWGTYIGYFSVVNTLDFDTRNYYCPTCAPSVASVLAANLGQSYQGCQNVSTNVGLKIRRIGVPTAGYYQIDLPYFDDETRLYINGSLVFSDPTWYNNIPETNVWTGYLDGTTQLDLWYQNDNGPGGAYIKFNYLGTTKPTALVGGTITSAFSAYCVGDLPTFTSTADASGACFPQYVWQYSSDNSTWTEDISATKNTYTSSTSLSGLTYFRRKATDVCGNGPVYSNTITLSPSATASGNPSIFGNGTWNAYLYNIYNINAPSNYVGYYTEPLLSFNTTNRFVSTASPHTASGYQGCQADPQRYTLSLKRTNFALDTFQIDLTYHDDAAKVLVDGVNIFTHTNCCDAHTNIWTGILKPTTQVEVVYGNGVGPGQCNVTITPVSPVGISTSGSVSGTQTICSGGSAAAFTETLAGASGCFVYYQWQSSTDNVTFNNIVGATLSTYTATGLTTTSYFRRKLIDACDNIAYSNVLKVTVLPVLTSGTVTGSGTYCNSASASLTQTVAPTGGDGVFTYQWQSSSDNITFTDVTSAVSASYSPTVTGTAYFRRKVISCANNAISNVLTIQAGIATSITMQPPTTYTACSGSTATISLSAIGEGLAYQWQYYNGSTYIVLANSATYSGVKTNSLTITNIISGSNTGKYRCVVSGTCSPTIVTSTDANVSIGGPTIATQPVATTVCTGSDTSLTVVASGSLTYQWQVSTNGGTVWSSLTNTGIYSGVTTNKLKFTAASGIDTYKYQCIVTSTCGNTTSSVATISLQTAITGNTATLTNSGSVCTGSNITLTGSTIASPTYQWFLEVSGNYTAISGATSKDYTASNVTSVSNYKRKVTVNTCSSLSPAYTITPTNPISITTQPVTPTVLCSGTATVSVTASNVFTYQWQKSTTAGGSSYTALANDPTYSGVTTSSLNIIVNTGLSGFNYRVQMIGCAGSSTPVNSSASNLVTTSTLTVSTNPINTSSCTNGTVTMTGDATASPNNGVTKTYKWQYNLGPATNNDFVDIPVNAYVFNYNTKTVSISNPPKTWDGVAQFRCIISSTCAAAVTTSAATLSVYNAISNNGINTPQTICSGDVPQLLTGSNPPTGGNGTFTYQWQESNGGAYSNIVGAGSVNYQPPALTSTNNYRRYAQSGNCQINYSFPVAISVGAPTAVTLDPTDANVCAGTNASFTITASGSALQYQWQTDNGTGNFVDISDAVNYSGYTSAILTVKTPSFAYNGYKYRCVVNGNCAPVDATSAAASLNLSTSPVITTQPSFASGVCEDAAVNLSIVASGTNLGYKWQSKTGSGAFIDVVNGTPYSGEASSVLIINPVATSLNGVGYRCVVSQSSCSVNSNSASMTVLFKPTFTVQPTDKNICANTNVTVSSTLTGAGLGMRWQLNPPSTFTDLNNGTNYSNVTTSNLNLITTPLSFNGNQYRLKVTGTCLPAGTYSNVVTVSVNGAGYWTGATNTDWNTGTNWCVAAPTISDNVTIPAGLSNYPVVSTSSPAAVSKSILIANGASLAVTGSNTFSVYGSWTNNGIFTPNSSTVNFIGTTPLAVGGTSKSSFYNLNVNNTSVVGLNLNTDANVINNLTLLPNTILNTGTNKIVLVSSATNTARLTAVPSTSSFVGNLAMQRYCTAKRAPRYIASPVAGATIAQLKDSVIIAGPTANGFDAPNTTLSTFKNYDETRSTTDYNKGWISATTISQSLVPGTGYYLYVPGKRSTVYPNTAPVTLQVKGSPIVGVFNKSLSYSPAGIQGWNFVGNPYPCDIDWNSSGISKNNIDNALYAWDATAAVANGQYYTYVNGIATPSKSNPSIIPSMSGFFVKANSAGASITFNESAKVSTNGFSVFRATTYDDFLRIKLSKVSNNDTISDEAVLYISSNATNGFDSQYDAYKFLNTDLNIYTSYKGYKYSINAINIASSDTIEMPLVVNLKTKSNFVIKFTEAEFNLFNGLYLKDNYLNTYTPVAVGTTYSASQNTDTASYSLNRFVLLNKGLVKNVITNVTDLNVLSGASISVHPNPVQDEHLTISINGFDEKIVDVQISDIKGAVVYKSRVNNNSKISTDVLKGFSGGVYVLKAMDSFSVKQIQIAKIK
jgi:hypothetical protein